jgi:hypothetical protein
VAEPALIKETKGRKRALAPSAIPPRELQYRQISDGWTPALVKSAFAQAESGSLLMLADLVETMFTDDRINGVLKTRTHGLLGLPLHFEGGTPEQRAELAGGLWDSMADEAEAAKLQAWGLVLGVGLGQRIPVPRLLGQPQRYRLRTWSPRWLYHDQSGVSGSTWRVTTRRGTNNIVPGVQWVVYTPYGESRPWASGEWRSLAFPWLLKHFALEDRANHSEVMGTPTKVGKAPQGASERMRVLFESQIKALGRNGALVLPEGWDYTIAEATGRTWEIYSEGIDWADKAMTVVLAGQIVTTEGSQGFSSGNVQDQIKGDLIRFDARALGKCLSDQYLSPWAFANTGSYSAPRPCWNTERPVNLMNQATAFETLGRAVADLDTAGKGAGVHVDVKALWDRYQVPWLANPPAPADTRALEIAPTDLASTVTVNEIRRSKGLGELALPTGALDPDGALTLEAYRGKHASGMPPGVSVSQHSMTDPVLP